VTPERRQAIGRIATTAAILSTWTIVLGIAVAWLNYRGAAGEPYTPLNHWISELGQPGVSARASVFNLALVAAGMEFVIFMVGLAQTSPSRLRWVFGPVGVVAGIGGAFVGIYPMNHPDQHVIAATTFFTLGWIAIGAASVTFLRSPDARFPRWLALGGVLPVVASIAFLVALRVDRLTAARMVSTGPIEGRPDVWLGPILEWAVLVAITGWTLLAGMTWRATLKPKPLAEGAR
jgi:hypothetical membrane protein